MKITAREEKGCFGFEMSAETLEEAAFLVRFGMNSNKELRCFGADATSDGRVIGHIVVGKRCNPTNHIQRAK